MNVRKDYLSNVKLPIAVLILLFFIQTGLIISIDLFTDLAQDELVNVWVQGGINFAFLVCAFLVIGWAGLRATRAMGGAPIDGAIAGAIAIMIAGFVVRVLSIMFDVSALPIMVANAPAPTGAAATAILGFFGIFVGIIGIIIGSFVDLLFGAFFGFLGAGVHNKRVFIEKLHEMKAKVRR